MAVAAAAFVDSLDAGQLAVARVPFTPFELSDTRREWSYLPAEVRPGLPLSGLSDPQRKLGHELIVASTSMPGYAKVVSIMAMEHVRRAMIRLTSPQAPASSTLSGTASGSSATPRALSPGAGSLPGTTCRSTSPWRGDLVAGTPCMLGSAPHAYGTLRRWRTTRRLATSSLAR